MTIEETRQAMLASRHLALPSLPLAVVLDKTIANVPVRVYQTDDDDYWPTLVFAHGGRFISGDLDTHDSLCRQ